MRANERRPLASLKDVAENSQAKVRPLVRALMGATAALGATDGYAQVIMFPVTDVALPTPGVTPVDLDGNGSIDFQFQENPDVNSFLMTAGDGENSQVLVTDEIFVEPLSLGQTVDAGDTFFFAGFLGDESTGLNGLAGNFYIGIKLARGVEYHYGFFALNKPNEEDYLGLTLLGGKYESQPNTAITVTAVPEPEDTLALMALGAAGVAAFRRHRRKQASTGSAAIA